MKNIVLASTVFVPDNWYGKRYRYKTRTMTSDEMVAELETRQARGY